MNIDFEELLKRCALTIDRRSKGYVDDAMCYARWISQTGKELVENLTAVQMRCTQLIEENRRLKGRIETLFPPEATPESLFPPVEPPAEMPPETKR